MYYVFYPEPVKLNGGPQPAAAAAMQAVNLKDRRSSPKAAAKAAVEDDLVEAIVAKNIWDEIVFGSVKLKYLVISLIITLLVILSGLFLGLALGNVFSGGSSNTTRSCGQAAYAQSINGSNLNYYSVSGYARVMSGSYANSNSWPW